MQEPRVLKLLTFRSCKVVGTDDQIYFIKIFVFELSVDAASNIQPIVAVIVKIAKCESAVQDKSLITTFNSLTFNIG